MMYERKIITYLAFTSVVIVMGLITYFTKNAIVLALNSEAKAVATDVVESHFGGGTSGVETNSSSKVLKTVDIPGWNVKLVIRYADLRISKVQVKSDTAFIRTTTVDDYLDSKPKVEQQSYLTCAQDFLTISRIAVKDTTDQKNAPWYKKRSELAVNGKKLGDYYYYNLSPNLCKLNIATATSNQFTIDAIQVLSSLELDK